MSEMFGTTPDYFLNGPYARWVRYRAYFDEVQRQRREAEKRGAR